LTLARLLLSHIIRTDTQIFRNFFLLSFFPCLSETLPIVPQSSSFNTAYFSPGLVFGSFSWGLTRGYLSPPGALSGMTQLCSPALPYFVSFLHPGFVVEYFPFTWPVSTSLTRDALGPSCHPLFPFFCVCSLCSVRIGPFFFAVQLVAEYVTSFYKLCLRVSLTHSR